MPCRRADVRGAQEPDFAYLHTTRHRTSCRQAVSARDRTSWAQPPVALSRPDPLGSACRHAAAALADAVGAVDRGARLPRLAPARRLRRRHLPHAQRRLRRQRRRRPRVRSPRQAHREAAGDERRGERRRGADARRGARARRLRAGPHDQPRGGGVERRRPRGDARLSVQQALLRDAAGRPRHRLQLRHPDGVRRGARRRCLDDRLNRRRGAGAGVVAALRQPVLGARLRHRVRDGRSRRRPAHRHQDLGDHARPLRRRRGDAVLCRFPARSGPRPASRSATAGRISPAWRSPLPSRPGTSP